jgi:DNA-binding transcriptional ArsR family regulator
MIPKPELFASLADPTRLQILAILAGGEKAVNDIVEQVNVHQSGVSRHLRVLHAAGFVQVRPDGPRRLYSLRAEPFRELDGWMTAYRKLWEARLDRFGAAIEQKTRARKGPKRSVA